MSVYASCADFVLRVGEVQSIELTDREGLGVVDNALLDLALADSASQMDGYLCTRYKLPLKEIPQNLVRLCCDLTRYRLASMSGVAITDEIIERYKLSLKELEAIAKGAVSLGIPEDPQNGEDAFSGAVFFSNHQNRVFRRDNNSRECIS